MADLRSFQIPSQPDWEGLVDNIARKGTPDRVYHIELFHDREVQDAIIEPATRLITGRRGTQGEQGLHVTAEELQAIVELAADEGVVGRDESDMIGEVLRIHATKAHCLREQPPVVFTRGEMGFTFPRIASFRPR